MTTTWNVEHRKMNYDRATRKWSTVTTVLASGVSQAAADSIMARHPDRMQVVAFPVQGAGR